MVRVKLSDYNKFISFNNCTFQNNHAKHSVVSIIMGIDEDFTCAFIPNPVNFSKISEITIREGHYALNKGNI